MTESLARSGTRNHITSNAGGSRGRHSLHLWREGATKQAKAQSANSYPNEAIDFVFVLFSVRPTWTVTVSQSVMLACRAACGLPETFCKGGSERAKSDAATAGRLQR